MPQLDAHFLAGVEIDLLAGRIEDAGGVREARDPAAFKLEGPDQPAREGRDERLGRGSGRRPDFQRPACDRRDRSRSSRSALRLQGLADFLDLLLERFQRVGVAIFNGGGWSTEWLAARVAPVRFEGAVFPDDQLDARGADCDHRERHPKRSRRTGIPISSSSPDDTPHADASAASALSTVFISPGRFRWRRRRERLPTPAVPGIRLNAWIAALPSTSEDRRSAAARRSGTSAR